MSKQVVRVVEERCHVVVAAGSQGQPGTQGPIGPSGGSATSAVSDTPIGGHRFVYFDSAHNAKYASNDVLTHAAKVVGMTLGATNAGDVINVLRSGAITEPSWSWVVDQPVFLGANGLMTQTQPEAPALFSLIVGFPITATTLFISIREPIFF